MRAIILCCVTALTAGAQGQTTWLVGQGGSFAEVRDAMASSQVKPGDVLQLTTPAVGQTFSPFTLTKGVVVRGPATLRGFRNVYDLVVRLAPEQHAHIEQLTFRPGYCMGGSVGRAVVEAGSVSMDRCSIFGIGDAGLEVKRDQVFLTSCDVSGSNGDTRWHAADLLISGVEFPRRTRASGS